MARVVIVAFVLLVGLVAPLSAQQPIATDAIDELKALVFVLQTRLADVEKQLGEEKKRRAELEIAELIRARETLDPAVKKKLGLPVHDAPKSTEKPAPQTPPK